METGRNPTWEQDGHAPIKANRQEDGGGAPNPSTFKDEWALALKKINKLNVFLCFHTLGRAMRQKERRLALGEACITFYMLLLVASMLKKAMHG